MHVCFTSSVKAYFLEIHLHLPVLHEDRFLSEFDGYLQTLSNDSGWRPPGVILPIRTKRGDRWVLLDAIIACALVLNTSPQCAGFAASLGGVRCIWTQVTNNILLEAWSRPGLEVVQALVIISFASMMSDWNDMKGGWNIIGLAARLR